MGNASGISVHAHCTWSMINNRGFYKKNMKQFSYFQILICCKINDEKNLTSVYVRYELYIVSLLPFYDKTVVSFLFSFGKVISSVLLFIKLKRNIFAVHMAKAVVNGQSCRQITSLNSSEKRFWTKNGDSHEFVALKNELKIDGFLKK